MKRLIRNAYRRERMPQTAYSYKELDNQYKVNVFEIDEIKNKIKNIIHSELLNYLNFKAEGYDEILTDCVDDNVDFELMDITQDVIDIDWDANYSFVAEVVGSMISIDDDNSNETKVYFLQHYLEKLEEGKWISKIIGNFYDNYSNEVIFNMESATLNKAKQFLIGQYPECRANIEEIFEIEDLQNIEPLITENEALKNVNVNIDKKVTQLVNTYNYNYNGSEIIK